MRPLSETHPEPLTVYNIKLRRRRDSLVRRVFVSCGTVTHVVQRNLTVVAHQLETIIVPLSSLAHDFSALHCVQTVVSETNGWVQTILVGRTLSNDTDRCLARHRHD
jgi:hypothetical protein